MLSNFQWFVILTINKIYHTLNQGVSKQTVITHKQLPSTSYSFVKCSKKFHQNLFLAVRKNLTVGFVS